MDEKDHLGEKMRLKERAEEDRYFAERDRELLAKLKQAQEAEQEKTIRELARARCPQCGERLRQRPFHGVMIEECPPCQGIWLNQAKLALLSRHGGEEWIGTFLEGLVRVVEHPRD
ncbi:MAG: zf-TFIIB domain-containing protein [Deltaproteobacteria bacterium]|nr:zf-TFIIB domain-containing protein [Deltaproteobacteria bacterium]